MDTRIEKVYENNFKYLSSIIGLTIESAEQEQYFYEKQLNTESFGALKLTFSNGQQLTFNCESDAESLSINIGGFPNKDELIKDFGNDFYNWEVKDYLTKQELTNLGKIVECKIELLSDDFGITQSGCRIIFESRDFLNIWIIDSDNIFYDLNKTPPYQTNQNLKIDYKTC